MVNHEDQPQIQTDEFGNPFVMVNGKKQKVEYDENGKAFFVNENGEKQMIMDQ